jgi:DNA-binding FadR family transcriptional regulator
MSFSPIRRRRAFEIICDQIRERLLAGVLRPGMRLPTERELAEQLVVSRTSIREAMRTLEHAGVVTIRKGSQGGAFIRQNEPTVVAEMMQSLLGSGAFTLNELTEARVLIQDVVVHLACERGTAADFKVLAHNIDQTEEATRTGRVLDRIELSIEFYRLLASATRNRVIALVIDSLSSILLDFLRARFSGHPDVVPLPALIESRRKFLKYLVARDANRASREISSHLQELHRHLLRSSPSTEDRGQTV